MPRAFTTWNRAAPAGQTPVASVIGEDAIALQLMPEHLQATDSGRHLGRRRKTTASQSSTISPDRPAR